MIALPLVFSIACGDRRASSLERRATSDDFGTPVPDGRAHRPVRIVSLNPGTTELLFAIGAGPRVVGRTTWDVWPDSARAVADLGPGMRPNVEAVLARKPDLVLLYASNENRAAAAQLEAAHIPVLALKVDRIEDFRRATRILGRATDDSARAAAVVDSVSRTLERVRAETAALPHPSVFWHVWDAPLYTIGAGSFLDELVVIAGGRNIYHDFSEPSPQVSLEDIVRRDPDVILAGPEGKARIETSPAWRSVRAVRAGRVRAVDTNLVGRPSVRLGEAAVSLARMLHPELAHGALP
jgi:iron complex transport system substrate-binding protein